MQYSCSWFCPFGWFGFHDETYVEKLAIDFLSVNLFSDVRSFQFFLVCFLTGFHPLAYARGCCSYHWYYGESKHFIVIKYECLWCV